MNELVTWLRAQLDEDEQGARDAGSGKWVAVGRAFVDDSEGRQIVRDEAMSSGVQPYIARHDPARVLAEVDAKRQLIKAILGYEAKIDGEWGCCHGAEEIGAGGCPDTPPGEIEALRALTLPYADQPGYRQEWRP